MEEVVYLQELWQKRAAVAEECGEELGELATALSKVVERNYFGIGCIEGESAYTAMRGIVDGGASSLVRLSDSTVLLSARASAAASAIAEEDADAAGEVRR